MNIRLIKTLILISGLVSACISLNQDPDFILLPCLPLVYGLLYYFLVPSNLHMGAGIATMTAVLYIRYIVYPVDLKISGYDIIGDPGLARYALLLMLYEMVAIMITLWFFIRKQDNVLQTAVIPKKINPLIPSMFAILMLYIMIFHPEVYADRRWIWQSQMINEETL